MTLHIGGLAIDEVKRSGSDVRYATTDPKALVRLNADRVDIEYDLPPDPPGIRCGRGRVPLHVATVRRVVDIEAFIEANPQYRRHPEFAK